MLAGKDSETPSFISNGCEMVHFYRRPTAVASAAPSVRPSVRRMHVVVITSPRAQERRTSSGRARAEPPFFAASKCALIGDRAWRGDILPPPPPSQFALLITDTDRPNERTNDLPRSVVALVPTGPARLNQFPRGPLSCSPASPPTSRPPRRSDEIVTAERRTTDLTSSRVVWLRYSSVNNSNYCDSEKN